MCSDPPRFTFLLFRTEQVVLTTLAGCELVGVIPVILALFYMCGGIYGTTDTDRLENFQTLTRDSLHNLVYPRSAPGSTTR